MDDSSIIKLYYERSEDAVSQTDIKYGSYCRAVALNILSVIEDAEECVNDTYIAAWEAIPPAKPNSLRVFLGRITRNVSISRFRKTRSQKRYNGMNSILDELSECIPSSENTEQVSDSIQLTELINRWLYSLNEDDRALFIRRYWFGSSVSELAAECGCSANTTVQRLSRLRRKLKIKLESEGIII